MSAATRDADTVMAPRDEADVAEAVRDATGPLRVQGGGTRVPPTGQAGAGDVLSVRGLTGLTLYEPGALTVIARAGTPVAEVADALRAEGQHLPFEPMDPRPLLGTEGEPTVGGMVALNASGPRRVQVGACRDALIGVRFVDGTGTVIRNGGRVMKNVTGYDLVKLMAGARGTLGVLTEVAFKVLPAPAVVRTVALDGLAPRAAIAAMSAALGSPFEVTGAAVDADGRTLLRVEGSELSADYRAGRLVALLGQGAHVAQDVDWAAIRDCAAFAGTQGDVWRISVRPSDGARVIEALGGGARTLLDWGGGLVWAEVAPGRDLRAALAGIAGHATIVRADADTRARLGTVPPEAPGVAALTRGIRARFDPRGLFAAGAA